jgi:hypothetical protein
MPMMHLDAAEIQKKMHPNKVVVCTKPCTPMHFMLMRSRRRRRSRRCPEEEEDEESGGMGYPATIGIAIEECALSHACPCICCWWGPEEDEEESGVMGFPATTNSSTTVHLLGSQSPGANNKQKNGRRRRKCMRNRFGHADYDDACMHALGLRGRKERKQVSKQEPQSPPLRLSERETKNGKCENRRCRKDDDDNRSSTGMRGGALLSLEDSAPHVPTPFSFHGGGGFKLQTDNPFG